jgi:hypothetical protein
MTISVSNLNFVWANSSNIYTGIGANVNAHSYSAESRLIRLGVDGTEKFSVDVDGQIYIDRVLFTGGTTPAGGDPKFAFDQANLAYTHANDAYNYANTITGGNPTPIYNKANDAYDLANSSYNYANTINVGPAFDKANAANVLAFNTGIGANNYANVIAGIASNISNSYSIIVGEAGNNYANSSFTTIANGVAAFIQANAAYNAANSSNSINFYLKTILYV